MKIAKIEMNPKLIKIIQKRAEKRKQFDGNAGGTYLPKFLRGNKEDVTQAEREKFWEKMAQEASARKEGIVMLGDRQFVPLERYEALKKVADFNAQICRMGHISRKSVYNELDYWIRLLKENKSKNKVAKRALITIFSRIENRLLEGRK